MKILLALSYYVPNVSGLTIYAKNLAQELTKRGYIVTVLTSKHTDSLSEIEKHNRCIIERVPITWRIGKGPIMLTYPFRAFALVKKNDVINCHLPQFESFILVILAKLFQKRVILTYHTGLAWEGGIGNKIQKIALLMSHTIAALLADGIVSYTDDYASHSLFLGYFKRKIVCILPPVPHPSKNLKTTRSIEKMVQKKYMYKIGIAARFAPEKGFEYLFDAITFLEKSFANNFVILIAGPKNPIGEDSYYKKMQPVIKKYQDKIIFLNSLSSEEIGSFYSLLDVVVLPSINMTETFGLVQVEAMLSGTPVIASNLPGVRVPIQLTGMGKLIEKKDSQALAAAIITICTNKKNYIKSKKEITATFSIDTVIDQYEALFTNNSN